MRACRPSGQQGSVAGDVNPREWRARGCGRGASVMCAGARHARRREKDARDSGEFDEDDIEERVLARCNCCWFTTRI